MTGDGTAEPETLAVRHPDDEVEQFGSGDVGAPVEIFATGLPHPWQGVAEGHLARIVPQYEGAAEVRLPLFEDRPQIEVNDVVVGDHPVRWARGERLQGILAG